MAHGTTKRSCSQLRRGEAALLVHFFQSEQRLFYAVVQLLLNGNGWSVVISASLALIFVALTLFLTVKYRPGRPAPRG